MSKYLEFNSVSKAYPGVQALQDISFRVQGGEVSALLGENGAGKSTLLKILSGDIRQDVGTLILDGKELRLTSPQDALKAGISVIYQERQLIPMMSIAENIFIDELPIHKTRLLDKKLLRKKTQELINKFGLPLDPDMLVGQLPVAYQQMIEIMKAYRRNSEIIAFDEPTAPLTEAEIKILFRLIAELREEDKIIIYVSHRLAEIFQVTDKIVILKDGHLVNKLTVNETNEKELIQAMVGRDIGDTYTKLKRNDKIGDVVLEVKNLCTDMLHNVSFSLRRGEVLGFAGLVGAGRTEVMRAVFGVDPIISGEVYINGSKVEFKSPKDAIKAGIALCPEDRKEEGLVLQQTIKCNVSMPILSKITKNLLIDRKQETALADDAVSGFNIKTPTVDKKTVELSGGNQQKVILGRWTSKMLETDILMLDEPTKGIDVGTKAEIYQMICNFAIEGKGVVLISSELTEVLNVSDNIIVMHNGRITGRLTRQEATEENVLALAMKE